MVNELGGDEKRKESQANNADSKDPVGAPVGKITQESNAQSQSKNSGSNAKKPKNRTWERIKQKGGDCARWLNKHGNAVTAVATIIIAATGIVYTSYARGQWQATNNLISQTGQLYERPWVWVKVPDAINVQIGQPITTSPIEFNNLSKTSPTMIRASIYTEWGPYVIDTFASNLAREGAGQTFMSVRDEKGNLKILLPPESKTTEFIPQPRQGPLTPEEYKRVKKGVGDGSIEVVVYGRYFYNDLSDPVPTDRNPKDTSIAQYFGFFCYYLMRDGKISACPDKSKAYTNWWGNP